MSGIYIPNLEMPKQGELLVIEIWPDGKVSYHLDLKSIEIATAIPVPDHDDNEVKHERHLFIFQL